MDKSTTFTLAEIAAATDSTISKLRARVRRLVEAGTLPEGLSVYHYDQVLQILRAGRKRPRTSDPAHVQVLKRQLIDDGMARK